MHWNRVARDVGKAAVAAVLRTATTRVRRRGSVSRPAPRSGVRRPQLDYAPQLNGRADPGEVVWTWVPYEEDATKGKDRPVIIMGRDGRKLLGLMLSTNPRHAHDPRWLSLGAGAWDGQGRDSWVRLDRVLELSKTGIRREGAVLDRARFAQVARTLVARYGWGS